ncbi:hypothetical protein ALISP_2185 [Alicycliphilus sp. B1]|nr:hypothetical protein ALISP_2185 [Alicycliphilus sp. B1]
MKNKVERSYAGCPARAGIGPSQLTKAECAERLPRASGDRPLLGLRYLGRVAVAPRERG